MDSNCKAPILSIVVPCYNEEEVISDTSSKLLSVLRHLIAINKISESSIIYFVDDGSTDATWANIVRLSNESGYIKGLKLTRNYGHQNALLAGLLTTKGDITVSIDADLQDDVNAIEKMVDEYTINHSDIVYGVRSERQTDTFFKRTTANVFYKFMRIMGVDIIENHADFRLMSRKAVQALSEFRETNLFLRGIVPLIGFKSSIIYYQRSARAAGLSKYPIGKMVSLAIMGVTSFSVVPLRFISILGLSMFVISSTLSLWVLFVALFSSAAVPGWASTVLPIYLIGGVQLLSLGVIGEYIGKIYSEVKARPVYLIDREIR